MVGPPTVVVCALEFERRRLAHALGGRIEIVRVGPGPQRAAACVDRLAARGVERMILAGVAGGLRTTPLCPLITRVVDREGNAWSPNLEETSVTEGLTLLGVDEPVAEPDEKAALGVAHAADLVDCESHAFAARAAQHGLAWTVVRGVSDGPADRLDQRILRWTDADGCTRLGTVLADVARRPRLIGAASRLARRASRAMHAVCARVDGILAAPERVRDG